MALLEPKTFYIGDISPHAPAATLPEVAGTSDPSGSSGSPNPSAGAPPVAEAAEDEV